MALILDTRFLIAHTFPPTAEDRLMVNRFLARISAEDLYLSVISVAEFLKIAGARVGREAAKARVNAIVRAGVKPAEVTLADGELAGSLLLSNSNLPIADAIIAAQAMRLKAGVVSDDPHYHALGLKVYWYR